MNSYEIFLRSPEDLSKVLGKIRDKGVPEHFDLDFLESLGLEKNSAILYLSLFRRLGLIDENDKPDPDYFERFVESEEEARKVIAELVRRRYGKLFELREDAHLLDKTRTRKLFRNLLEESKSETIVNLIADTFWELAQYADWESHEEELESESVVEAQNNSNEDDMSALNVNQDNVLNELLGNSSENKYNSDETVVLEDQSENHSEESEVTDEETDQQEKMNAANSDDKMGETNTMEQENVKTQVASDTSDQGNEKSITSKGGTSVMESGINQTDFLKKALVRRAELLEKLDRVEEAIKAYDDIIAYSQDDKYNIEADIENTAFYKKASLLEKMEDYDEAVSTYDQYIKRFG